MEKNRKDMNPAFCWNLTDIYPDTEAWEKALADASELVKGIPQLAGTLGSSAESLKAGLDAIYAAVKMMEERPWDAAAEIAFHEALAAASHNEVLAATLNLFISMITDFRNRFYSLPDYVARAQESHQAIYESVRDRDRHRARYEIERHLRIAQEFVDQHPEL